MWVVLAVRRLVGGRQTKDEHIDKYQFEIVLAKDILLASDKLKSHNLTSHSECKCTNAQPSQQAQCVNARINASIFFVLQRFLVVCSEAAI